VARLGAVVERGARVLRHQVGRRHRRGRERVATRSVCVLGVRRDRDDRVHRHRGLAATQRLPRRSPVARRPSRAQRRGQAHDRRPRRDGRQEPGGRVHAGVRLGATRCDVRAGDRDRCSGDLPRPRFADPGTYWPACGRDRARGRRSLRSRGQLRGRGWRPRPRAARSWCRRSSKGSLLRRASSSSRPRGRSSSRGSRGSSASTRSFPGRSRPSTDVSLAAQAAATSVASVEREVAGVAAW
jgi:hypothetical protein